MSVSMSSADQAVIERQVEVTNSHVTPAGQIEVVYELTRCAEWISRNKLTQVALQFSDSLLGDAASVTRFLADHTESQVFILADTSYGSCCVDEVAAQHYNADGLIHFGASCLSPTQRLPVLFVFGQQPLEVTTCCEALCHLLDDGNKPVLLLFDVVYHYCKDHIIKILQKNHKCVVAGELLIPNREKLNEEQMEKTSNVKQIEIVDTDSQANVITQFGRRFTIPDGYRLEDFSVFYIGREDMALTNWMLYLKDNTFYTYSSDSGESKKQSLNVNKFLMKRYYLIEKAKDAQIVGLLVGTLGVKDYMDSFNRMKKLCALAGKKTYTFVVGKLNVPKLANFMEIDLYVLVACPQNSLLDSAEFYRPVITPYELEMACNPKREWTGRIVSDFRNLLPGGSDYEKEPDEVEGTADVSLVTGGMRYLGVRQEATVSHGNQLATQKMEVSAMPSASALLAERTWQGLEQKLGQTPVEKARQGRKGIAMGYTEEPPMDSS